MDKSKAEVGRVREEKRKKYIQKRESPRKKIQVCEKVGKSRNISEWDVSGCGASWPEER
jgi:hypothetical protein